MFIKMLKTELPFDAGIPLLGIYPKKTNSQIQKDICNPNPMFTTALFTIAKKWKQTKCPSVDEWIKKRWYIYTIFGHKKETNPTICNNMDGARGYYAQ